MKKLIFKLLVLVFVSNIAFAGPVNSDCEAGYDGPRNEIKIDINSDSHESFENEGSEIIDA